MTAHCGKQRGFLPMPVSAILLTVILPADNQQRSAVFHTLSPYLSLIRFLAHSSTELIHTSFCSDLRL